jgi:beta-lactamase superfamily II metal-dependent hydrolase
MGELHHLAVGCADCSIIITDAHTFLIDTRNIERFSHLLPSSKHLRGVFITHQHYDHFDGLRFLMSAGYHIDILIYSPYERRYNDQSVQYDEWQEFNNLRDYFVRQGTELRTPYRQSDMSSPWWDAGQAKFWMFGPASYIACTDTRRLHDASLVLLAQLEERRCLFTGDASDENLEYVATNTNNICDDILHASHHGSLDGASLTFIKACNASYTVVSTEAGIYENIPHPTALRRYKENTKNNVYRTDNDGSLKWKF